MPFSAYRCTDPSASVTLGAAKEPESADRYVSAHCGMSPLCFHRSASERVFSIAASIVRWGLRTVRITRGRRSIVQQVRFKVKRQRRRRNHQEWYMSNRLIRSIRLYAQSSYTWRYFSGGWFCWMTVPRMEVTASRMIIQIASFIEIRKFQIRVATGFVCFRSMVAEAGTRSVRTSDAVSIRTPLVKHSFFTVHKDARTGSFGDRRSENGEERDQRIGGLSREKEGASYRMESSGGAKR